MSLQYCSFHIDFSLWVRVIGRRTVQLLSLAETLSTFSILVWIYLLYLFLHGLEPTPIYITILYIVPNLSLELVGRRNKIASLFLKPRQIVVLVFTFFGWRRRLPIWVRNVPQQQFSSLIDTWSSLLCVCYKLELISHCNSFEPSLGAFTKLRNSTISFVITLSVCPHVTARLPLDGFSWNLTLRLLMSYIYIYMEHLFLMFLDHTQRRSTVSRTPLD